MDFEQKFYKTSARKWWKISNVTSIVDNNPLQVMTPRSYRFVSKYNKLIQLNY